MTHFLLVHGGCHGAWCWDRLVRELRSRGCGATAFDLPGGGTDPTPPEKVFTKDYLEATERVLSTIPSERVQIVGHSIAGFWIPELVASVYGRIECLHMLAAAVLQRGERGIDLIPESRRARYLSSANTPEIGLTVSFAEARERFFNGLPSAEAKIAFEKLRPQSVHPYFSPSTVDPALLKIPRRYLLAERDLTFEPPVAESFARKLGVVPDRIDAGHGLMMTHPKGVADWLCNEATSADSFHS